MRKHSIQDMGPATERFFGYDQKGSTAKALRVIANKVWNGWDDGSGWGMCRELRKHRVG